MEGGGRVPKAGTAVAIAAALRMHIQPLVISPSTFNLQPFTTTGHNINRSDERGCTVDTSCRTLEHFDADDVVDVDGQIHRIVPCLRVTDVNAVEQQDDLFGSAATDGNVCLGSDGSPLPDIDADGILQ